MNGLNWQVKDFLRKNILTTLSALIIFLAAFLGGYVLSSQKDDSSAGGYYGDRYNGTYLGFVGGDKVQYVIAVRVNEPKVGKYAGSGAAQPIFGDLAHMLIDNFNVVPKSQ